MAGNKLSIRDDPRFAQVLAGVGTKPWAEYCRQKLQKAVDTEANTVISFSSEMAIFVGHKGWQLLTDAKSKPFKSFRSFALTKLPYGLGCTEDQLSLLLREAQKSVEDRAVETKELPQPEIGKGKPGPGRGNKTGSHTTRFNDRGADYLTARIARDNPDILERMKAGEFKSVRQAALEAGIVHRRISIPTEPEAAARTLRKVFNPADLARLASLITAPQANE
jgi:hypothetical protein